MLLFERRRILGMSDASTDGLLTDDGVDALDVGGGGCTKDASMLYARGVDSSGLSCGEGVPRVDCIIIESGSVEDATTYCVTAQGVGATSRDLS